MIKGRKAFLYSIFVMVAMLILVLIFSTGRVSTAIIAFKGNMEMQRLARQLFKTYSAMGGLFSFELPEAWSTSQAAFEGGEINYHLSFISKDKKIHGFVQVWKLNKSLKQFIEESKMSAVGIMDCKDFIVKEIMTSNKQGYTIEYSRANEKGEYIKAYEGFIEGYGNDVFRVSFFVPEKEWKDYYKLLFDRIISSIRIKKV